jgi:hypothetical protein
MISLQRRGIIGGGVLDADPAGPLAANTANPDGSSQYFQTVDSATFDFGTGGFSLSAWVNFDSFPDIPSQPDVFRIIGEGRGVSGSGPKKTGWSLYYNSTSSLLTLDQYTGTQTSKSVTWSASTSTWYHITVVRDGDDVKFYIDGSQQGSTQTGVSAISYNREESNGVYMGRLEYGSSSTSYLDGSMGPYGVWDAALSASEITTLYNSGVAFCYGDLSAALTTNLVSYWHLANWSGSSGTEIEDRHGSNDVTNVGTTPFTGSGLTVECS